jgi:hypothetical protein
MRKEVQIKLELYLTAAPQFSVPLTQFSITTILILVTINPDPFSEFFRSVFSGIYGVESEQITLLY